MNKTEFAKYYNPWSAFGFINVSTNIVELGLYYE